MNYQALTGHESGIWVYPNRNALICNYNGVSNSTPKLFAQHLVWYGPEYPNVVEDYKKDVDLTDYLRDVEIVYWEDCKEDDIKKPLKGDAFTFDDGSTLLVPEKWN